MSIKKISKIDVHHPHDSFFKKSMEDPKVARDFIRAHLPSSTLAFMDLDSLELQPSVHSRKIGKQLASDIIYKVNIANEEGYLYFALEHQSCNDPIMAFRLVRYMIEIMETALVASKKIPLVIPVVVYHGETECSMEMDFRNLIEAPRELIDRYWLQPFQLIDLTKIKDEALANHQFASLIELALKSTYDFSDSFYLKKIIEVHKKYSKEGRELNLELVLEYLFVSNKSMSHSEFIEMVYEALPEDGDSEVLTIAEQCIEEGRQEGHQEGYKQAQSEIKASLIARGFDSNLVEELVDSKTETV